MPMSGVAFILYTFYMVTDPPTTPGTTRNQIFFGASVGDRVRPVDGLAHRLRPVLRADDREHDPRRVLVRSRVGGVALPGGSASPRISRATDRFAAAGAGDGTRGRGYDARVK